MNKYEDANAGASSIMFGKRQPALATREKRRAERKSANAPAVVQTTASRLRATIVNISPSGARLVTADWPPPRQDVQIIVNGIYLFGTIAWRREKAFGVRFEEGLNGYTPDEIQRAIDDASEPIYEFDRDAILSTLMNREPSERQPNINAHVAEYAAGA